MIVDEFTELSAAATQVPLVMSIVLHSFITGVPFRLRAVRRALESIAGADGVWFTTPREIHRAVVESSRTVPAAGRGGDVVSEPAAAPNNTAQVSDYSLSLVRNGIRSQVLKNIDLQIRSGEILGLVGESGSGKSVLALSLLGLLPDGSHPHADGAVTVGGVDMLRAKPAELRRVRREMLGAIFQDPMTSLNPTMRIGRQIGEVTHDDAESVRLLETVGVRDAELRLRVYPHELSGGLRQRVMAAIAVAGRPGLIVADEPTTALDVTVQAQLLDLLRELRADFGCSVLLITHDLGVADQIADRLAVLHNGELVEIGPAASVVRNPQHDYTRSLLASRLTLTMPRDERFTRQPPTQPSPR